MMMHRRGLTLLEVLAAAVLLTVLATTCMPLLRKAMRDLREPEESVAIFDLAQFADDFVADPSAFDAESITPVAEAIQVPWLEHPDRPAVRVLRLNAIGSDTDHAWLRFACGNRTVVRWIAVEVDRPQEPAP